MQIAVYCGSKPGHDAKYLSMATEVGRRLAERGHHLIYGGARVGLMGAMADSVLAGGGEVLGVIPEALMSREVAHPGLTRLAIVKDMHERKAQMAAPADAFVALPGGPGTMEELFEMWTWQMLGYHNKPVALLNFDGYYDPLIEMIQRMTREGFAWADLTETLIMANSIEHLFDQLEQGRSGS